MIQETSPDRGSTVLDYDARGLVISRKDARNVQTIYGYDNAGRLTTVSYPATPSLNVSYTWEGAAAGANGKGHLTHFQDAAGSTDFYYDAVGRTTGEVRTFGSTSYTMAYTYDASGTGRLAFETLPSGRVLTYGYDAFGRVTSIGLGPSFSGPFQSVVSGVQYFPPAAEVRGITFGNGVVKYQNDTDGRIDGLFLTSPSGAALVTRYHYFGDGLNLLKLNNDAIDPATSQSFTYDDAQRLLSGSGPFGSRTWTYDKVGNRLTEAKTVSGTTTSTTWAYPTTSNLLTNVKQGTAATRAFGYDAAGDTATDARGSTAYAYTISDAGRIAQLKVGGTVTAGYAYDAKDRLSVRQTQNMTPSGTTQYLYDAWDHLLAETNGSGTVVREYIWLGDTPVAVLDGSANPASPALLFVHADHLKRPELMTNGSGAVVWKAVYEPFGAVWSITGTASNMGRFPGQWFQLEAGLHYNWHRHYDPTLGRYTSPDPLGVSRAGPSVFGYVRQSPLMLTDVRGLDNPGMGPYDPPGPSRGLPGCNMGADGPPGPPDGSPPPFPPMPGPSSDPSGTWPGGPDGQGGPDRPGFSGPPDGVPPIGVAPDGTPILPVANDGTPGNNQRQNDQVTAIVKKLGLELLPFKLGRMRRSRQRRCSCGTRRV